MKKKLLISILTYCITVLFVHAQLQINAGFVPGNRTLSASLEKNLLFNATTRYTVTQSGVQAYSSEQLSAFFDGAMHVEYSQSVVTPSNDLVILLWRCRDVNSHGFVTGRYITFPEPSPGKVSEARNGNMT